MAKIYESRSNVYIPALKEHYPAGTRFSVDGEDNITAGSRTVPADPEFQLMIRHGLFREVAPAETGKPESKPKAPAGKRTTAAKAKSGGKSKPAAAGKK